jgi:hypothetical protein
MTIIRYFGTPDHDDIPLPVKRILIGRPVSIWTSCGSRQLLQLPGLFLCLNQRKGHAIRAGEQKIEKSIDIFFGGIAVFIHPTGARPV